MVGRADPPGPLVRQYAFPPAPRDAPPPLLFYALPRGRAAAVPPPPRHALRSPTQNQNFTVSRNFRLCGICSAASGDSSSIKYHFTPTFFAAFRMAGQSIFPVPSATSFVTSDFPVISPVLVPFFMSLRCINSQRLPYLSSSFTG